jgi:hypothetical protein
MGFRQPVRRDEPLDFLRWYAEGLEVLGRPGGGCTETT